MKRLFIFLCGIFALVAGVNAAPDVVVLDDSIYVEASSTDCNVTHRRVVLIPDKKSSSAAEWGYVCDKNIKLKSFSAVFTTEDGKVLQKVKKGGLQMTELSSSLADESYTYFLNDFPPVYPQIVTMEWTVTNHNGVISYPLFSPMDDYGEQVRRASYTIRCSSDNPCRYRMVNCDALLKQGKLSVTQQSDGSVKTVFNQLPSIKQEDCALPLFKQLPMVFFAPSDFSYLGTQGKLDTWRNFGLWEYGLLQGRGDLPESMRQKVHEMTDAMPGKRDKIARLYQYLYDNTRYVSIQLGIGGYQPIKAADVATAGFGDCKGLSNFMIALLREAGIPAIYAGISTKYADLLKDFPNLNQMNHAIVCVPMEKDSLWLECTNARIPLGYVHEEIAGHDALLVTADGGKVVRLPQYADAENMQKATVQLALDPKGKVSMTCNVKATNRQYEAFMPLVLVDANRRQRELLASIYFPGAQVETLKMEEAKGKAEINTLLKATSDRYANVSSKRMFIHLNPLKADYENISSDENRQSSFELDYGYCDEEDVTLDLPEGYRVEAMPADKEITSKFASFKLTFKQEGNRLHALYRLVMHRGVYEAKEYQDFVKTKNAIAKAYRQQVVIVHD